MVNLLQELPKPKDHTIHRRKKREEKVRQKRATGERLHDRKDIVLPNANAFSILSVWRIVYVLFSICLLYCLPKFLNMLNLICGILGQQNLAWRTCILHEAFALSMLLLAVAAACRICVF